MLTPLSLLLVDDLAHDFTPLDTELREGGYEPVFALIDSEEGFRAALQKCPWDVIIARADLPQLRSERILERLKQEDKIDIPLIMVSDTFESETSITAIAGVPSYIMRNRQNGLLPTIEKELKKSRWVRTRQERQHALHESEEALKFRAYQQQLTTELGLIALSGIDPEKLIEITLSRVSEIMNMEFCAVFRLLSGSHNLLLTQGVGWDKGLIGNVMIRADDASHPGLTLKSRQPVVIENLKDEGRFSVGTSLLRSNGISSGIAVVVFANGQPYGVFSAHSKKTRTFSKNDVNFFQSIANILSLAIERKASEEQLRDSVERERHSLERERLLRNIVEISSQTRNLDHTLHQAILEIGRMLDVSHCIGVRYTDPATKAKLKVCGQWYQGKSIPSVRMDEVSSELLPLLTCNLNLGQTIRMLDFASAEEYLLKLEEPVRQLSRDEKAHQDSMTLLREIYVDHYEIVSILQAGISYRGTLYGAITIHQCKEKRRWREEDLKLIQDLTRHLGVVFYQDELFRQEQEARQNAENSKLLLEEANKKLADSNSKLLRSNQDLNQFATVASHDLQAPLRKVQMFGDYIKQRIQEKFGHNVEIFDFIERQQKATRKMQNLINDLLALSRVTRRGNPFGSVEMDKVMDEVISDLQVPIQETNALIEVTHMLTIEADFSQMQQLMQNLIQNAIKFHKKDTQPVIKVHMEKINQDSCQIVITDNGIGFKEENRHKIFDVFTRLHSESEYHGSGIGLAICKKIVERHEGSINVHSVPGDGSIFYIRLPIKQPVGARLVD